MPTEFRLGKKPYVPDERTLQMATFVRADISAPPSFSVDQHRKPFPNRMWGNDTYGDCVFAGRANQQLRLERIEQRKTIPLKDDDVINLYKRLTGCVSPGDAHDEGFVILYAMRQWKNEGWKIGARGYTIHAYGELSPQNHDQLRMGCYALAGIQFGFNLPWAMRGKKEWVYNGETGGEWEPGSWGGHCVYGLGYGASGFIVKTWGMDVKVNWDFIDKYADEAWAVVDMADSWRVKQTIDVEKLDAQLHSISPSVDQ